MTAAALLATAAHADPPEGTQGYTITHRHFYQGSLVEERGYMNDNRDLGIAIHYTHKPNHPGGNGGGNGGGGGDGGGSDPGTDCGADQYRTTGYYWPGPYSATASSHASVFNTAAETWDAETGADIFGSITTGSGAAAGVQDFVNQIDFADLGASTTIAVTTTWYYTSTGQAVESDAQYNTYYAWATDGNPDSMDVQAVGTHELGHTFGLDHPNGPPHKISCLTMYAYGDEGNTHERTLGDGDILGIRAVYSA